MSREDLIDSKTQKTIAQHNWLKGHEFISEYGGHYQIAGLLGGGFSESYLAAFKLDANGNVERNDYGQPRVHRLATTPVITYLNARGIFASWDPRSKAAIVESPEAGAILLGVDEDESEVPEVVIPETSKPKVARELAEARLIASIANLGATKRGKAGDKHEEPSEYNIS